MSGASKVLIVDDEPNVRLVFRTALESDEYRITTAADGETALAWLGQERFDVVLLDLQMPGVDGMSVLARLREWGNRTPVIIVSAHDRPPTVVRAVRLGAIDFLSKPIAPGALRRAVADVLEREARGERDGDLVRVADRPRSLLISAKRALGQRLFHRAGVLLREVIDQEPLSAEPRYLLGVLREVEGKPKSAAEAYRDALRVDPNYEPAKLHLIKFQDAG
jgi:DNA-binding NtrC family response regulator